MAMSKNTKSYLQRTLSGLIEATSVCREDMHEPDEQGISAVTAGYILDNAMGDNPRYNCGELTVGIKSADGSMQWFNLSTLIALARKANLDG